MSTPRRPITRSLMAIMRLCRDARASRLIVRTHACDLQPGWYWFDNRLARRIGSPLPQHLEATKTRRSARRSEPTQRRIVFLMRRALTAVPRRVSKRIGDPLGAVAALHSWEGSTLLIAPEAGWVRRVASEPRFDVEYRELRERFADCVPIPPCSVKVGGHVIVEEFVHGAPFQFQSHADQRAAVCGLLERLASLVERHSTGSARAHYAEQLDRIKEHEIPRAMRRYLNHTVIDSLLLPGPLVPSHGDLKKKNVIVIDGHLIVIDLGDSLAWRGFWVDALKLVWHCSPQDFLDGCFDDHLRDLWSAAGFHEVDIASNRASLVAAHVLFELPALRWTQPPVRWENASTSAVLEKLWSGRVPDREARWYE